MRRLLAPHFVVLALLSSGTAVVGAQWIDPDDLLDGVLLGIVDDPRSLIREDQVLSMSEEMGDFLRAHVDQRASPFVRLHQLTYAIIGDGTFGLQYDTRTRTASEAFHMRRGNCMSFSVMFAALARGLDLDARFQEVEIPPDWSVSGDAFVLNRHVNVVIDLGLSGVQAVDFNIEDFRASYDRRTIEDRRALAHFFNNLAVERLDERDIPAALSYFRTAIRDGDRDFAPAWTNLGILYLRENRGDLAEVAWHRALRADRDELVAMSNLAGLYEQLGDERQASHYRKRVARHRWSNPYYRYALAREAFFERDYEGAVKHLKFAVRERENEDQFCFLLGMCYLQLGDTEEARRWIERAEEVAASETLKRSYARKLDILVPALD